MKILITGISICGKSTLRRKLVDLLCQLKIPFFQFDVDGFITPRDDRDLYHVLELEEVVSVMGARSKLVLIEDVHGPLKSALNSLSSYDLILYVEAGFASYFMFWLTRAMRWYQTGQFAYTKEGGWEGTAKSRDPRNFPGIARHLLRACLLRGRWVKEDLKSISRTDTPVLIIKSYWTLDGPRFSFKL